MTQQLDFRFGDGATSRQAAFDNRPRRGTHRWIALQWLVFNSLTDFELAARSHIAQTSIGKRRKELQDLGFVEFAGCTRPAPSGCQSMVWQVTPAGKAYWYAERDK